MSPADGVNRRGETGFSIRPSWSSDASPLRIREGIHPNGS
jgi:hypothetical protein